MMMSSDDERTEPVRNLLRQIHSTNLFRNLILKISLFKLVFCMNEDNEIQVYNRVTSIFVLRTLINHIK